MPCSFLSLSCQSSQVSYLPLYSFHAFMLSCCCFCSVMQLTAVCRVGPALDFFGRKHSFSGFLSLDEHWLGIGYLWHARGAWVLSDHDVDPQLCLHRRNGGNLLLSLFSVFSTIVLYRSNLFSNRFSHSNVSWDSPWVYYYHIYPSKNFINTSIANW